MCLHGHSAHRSTSAGSIGILGVLGEIDNKFCKVRERVQFLTGKAFSFLAQSIGWDKPASPVGTVLGDCSCLSSLSSLPHNHWDNPVGTTGIARYDYDILEVCQ